MEKEMPRLAVLIDAENAQLAILPELLAEIAKIGIASVKRVYGDFTTPALSSWRDPLLTHSIQPIQQFRNTKGKNASDSALIIDAMDLLHSKKFSGFCIVSSDSDFTRLMSRIKEEGVLAYGFGEQKTPKSFIAACDKFTYTEILKKPVQAPPQPEPAATLPSELSGLAPVLVDAVESCDDEAGWSDLGQVGTLLINRIPEFDPRQYGFSKLSLLIRASGIFEIQKREDGQNAAPVSVRLKPGSRTSKRAVAVPDATAQTVRR